MYNLNKEYINYLIRHSDFMEHITIRIEPPILDIVPEIIYEDKDLLIVDKPPSVLVFLLINKYRLQNYIYLLPKSSTYYSS